jgi:hypothetical protein
MSSPPDENHPLLPPSSHLATPSRSKLGARRYIPNGSPDDEREGVAGTGAAAKSDKARGKQRAVDVSDDERDAGASSASPSIPTATSKDKGKGKQRDELGRAVTVIFSDDAGNLEVWVDEGESVGHVKEKVSVPKRRAIGAPEAWSVMLILPAAPTPAPGCRRAAAAVNPRRPSTHRRHPPAPLAAEP